MKAYYWNYYKLGATVYLLITGILGAILPLVSFTTKYLVPTKPISHIYVGYLGMWDDTGSYVYISRILALLGIVTMVAFAIVILVDGILVPMKVVRSHWILSIKNIIFVIGALLYFTSYYIITQNIQNYLALSSMDPATFSAYSSYSYTKLSYSLQIESIAPQYFVSYYLLQIGFWLLLTLPIVRAFVSQSYYSPK